MEDNERHAFDSFLSMIPTRSSKPTEYRPRFSPLCAPDNAWNPITSALIVHFPSFTSIQCTVIPWNPIFVVSTDHPSWVMETFPGAASNSYKLILAKMRWHTLTVITSFRPFICCTNSLHLHIVGFWKVCGCWFWSYGGERIAKGWVISEC